MSEKGGIVAFCVPCFLFFVTICLGTMAFAGEGKQVGQFSTMSNPVTPSFAVKELSPQNPKGTPSIPPAAAPSINAVSKTWCIAKPSTPQDQLDKIIQYACRENGVDCTLIQQGGMCYNPTNLVSNAAVVMNIYYSVNIKHPFNCYFSGSGLIVDKDPSVGNCVYMA